MTPAITSRSTWIQPIAEMIAAHGARGAFFVALPEYRPELIRNMACELSLSLTDFREEKMLELGWAAAELSLEALTNHIEEKSVYDGLVVHNAEAILATKEHEVRRQWLKEFAKRDWPAPVIIPITVFQIDLPDTAGRFNRVDPDDLPQETLLTRLASR